MITDKASSTTSQLILLAACLGELVVFQAAPSNIGDNAQEFNALCAVASTVHQADGISPEVYVKNMAKWEAVERVAQEINDLLEQMNKSSDTVVVAGEDFRVQIPPGEPLKRARLMLRKYYEKLLKLKAKALHLRQEAESLVGKAKTSAQEAIGEAGADSKSLEDRGKTKAVKLLTNSGATTEDRSNVCKGAASRTINAGDALPIDMLCLCADQAGSPLSICGVALAASEHWASTTYNSGKTAIEGAWKKLADHCEALEVKADFSPRGLRAVRQGFFRLLGGRMASQTGGEAGVRHWILGKAVASGAGCTGVAAAGACVNYAAKTCSGSCTHREIKWLTNVDKAIADLEEANDRAAEMNETGQNANAIRLQAESVLLSFNASATTEHALQTGNQAGSHETSPLSPAGSVKREADATTASGTSRKNKIICSLVSSVLV